MLSHSADEKLESRRPGSPRLIQIINSSIRTQTRLLDSRSWALHHCAFSAYSVQLGTSNRMRNHDTQFSLDWGIRKSPLDVSCRRKVAPSSVNYNMGLGKIAELSGAWTSSSQKPERAN